MTLLDRYPRQLSGGQRQRVALARAMIRRPAAFLMDEPLSNLDAKLRGYMRAELKHMQHQLGITTIYVTHDQIEAMTLAHRVALLEKGVLQQLDTPANIYNAPANLFVAGFIGSPPMNFLDGDLVEGRFSGPGGSFGTKTRGSAAPGRRRRPFGGLQGHGAERRQDRRRGLHDRAYGRPHARHLPGRRRHDHSQGGQDLQPARRRTRSGSISLKRPCTCSTRPPATGSREWFVASPRVEREALAPQEWRAGLELTLARSPRW